MSLLTRCDRSLSFAVAASEAAMASSAPMRSEIELGGLGAFHGEQVHGWKDLAEILRADVITLAMQARGFVPR